MTDQRRFKLPPSDPSLVTALPDDHVAMVNKQPLFMKRVVRAGESKRILIEGKNSRKIGNRITVGPWKGMQIYTLTLPERMTCPSSCHAFATCYGNAMPWSRRHLPGEDLEDALAVEVAEKALINPDGFVVRLHVLGDFYSVEYVEFWMSLLETYPELHIWGYTAVGTSDEPQHIQISEAIKNMNRLFPDRVNVRFSGPVDECAPGGATVLDYEPKGGALEVNGAKAVVCPAEREKDTCCATCGLCWAPNMADTTIAFVLHGMGSSQFSKMAKLLNRSNEDGLRTIAPIESLIETAGPVDTQPPVLIEVDPSQDLMIDTTYQRDFSERSLRLVRRIIANWDWEKFKPPIVCRAEGGKYKVLDGQHTSIAAATHPEIHVIPAMLVETETIEKQAESFVGHNKDRVQVAGIELHFAMLAAGNEEALKVDRVCKAAGIAILRSPPPDKRFAVGETSSISALRSAIKKLGERDAIALLGVLRRAGRAPIRSADIKACVIMRIQNNMRIQEIEAGIFAATYEQANDWSTAFSKTSGMSKTECIATFYQRAASGKVMV